MKSRKVSLKNFVVLVLSMIFGAQALVSIAEEAIEEVVVVGKSIKASTQSSLDAKRMADNVADVISADAMGRFPDQNLADALGRVPGIAIERDQGQARYVSFRGAPKRYTTTAFDGVDIPGVENGRVPRFDAYPTVITSQVVANKAITADMPGESISGYINVKTFLPSDVNGWSFSLEAGVGEQDLGGGDVEKFNGRVSFSNDQFGFVVYGSENLREQITDNRESDYSGTKGALIPNDVSFRNYRVKREDNAFGGTFISQVRIPPKAVLSQAEMSGDYLRTAFIRTRLMSTRLAPSLFLVRGTLRLNTATSKPCLILTCQYPT